jgi:hypothetical protein
VVRVPAPPNTIEELATPKVIVRAEDLRTVPRPTKGRVEVLRRDWRCARRCGIVIEKGTPTRDLDWLARGGWAHFPRCPNQMGLETAKDPVGEVPPHTLSPEGHPPGAPEESSRAAAAAAAAGAPAPARAFRDETVKEAVLTHFLARIVVESGGVEYTFAARPAVGGKPSPQLLERLAERAGVALGNVHAR